MGLEAATWIDQLNPAWPVGATDPKAQGDDNLRMLKSVLQAHFNSLGHNALSVTALQINAVCASGVTGMAVPSVSVDVTVPAAGVATTVLRSDARLQLSQAIAPTWTGSHLFNGAVGTGVAASGASPGTASGRGALALTYAGAAADNRRWREAAGINLDAALSFEALTDAGAAKEWLRVTRTGGAIASLAFGNATDNPTFSFLGTGAGAVGGQTVFSGGSGTVSAIELSRAANDVYLGLTTAGVQNWAIGNRRSDGALVFAAQSNIAGSLRMALTAAGTLTVGNVGGGDSSQVGLFAGVSKAVRIGTAGTAGFVEGVDQTGSGSHQPLKVGGSTLDLMISGTPQFSIDTAGRVSGASLHNNASAPTGTTQYIASGTYTPTFTNISNCSTFTSLGANWIRVGRVVTVAGVGTMTPTGAGASACRLSLPIASNLAAANELGGAGAYLQGTPAAVGVQGDSVNDQARLDFTATAGAAFSLTFNFQYVIN